MAAKLCVRSQDTSTIDSERFSEIRQVSAFFFLEFVLLATHKSDDRSKIHLRKLVFDSQTTSNNVMSDAHQLKLYMLAGHKYHRFRSGRIQFGMFLFCLGNQAIITQRIDLALLFLRTPWAPNVFYTNCLSIDYDSRGSKMVQNELFGVDARKLLFWPS